MTKTYTLKDKKTGEVIIKTETVNSVEKVRTVIQIQQEIKALDAYMEKYQQAKDELQAELDAINDILKGQ